MNSKSPAPINNKSEAYILSASWGKGSELFPQDLGLFKREHSLLCDLDFNILELGRQIK